MTPIDIGELRHVVEYQEAVSTPSKTGTPVKTWHTLWTGPAAVRPLSARELQYAGGTEAQTTHRLTIRYRTGVKHTGRFLLAGTDRVLNIASIADLEERHAWLVIQAIEKSA
jgi:SPP1 family predicted phage head-tail adaptor